MECVLILSFFNGTYHSCHTKRNSTGLRMDRMDQGIFGALHMAASIPT